MPTHYKGKTGAAREVALEEHRAATKGPFKLRSGNTTPFKKMGSSPLKQAIGGGPGEAIYHWKKYKAAKAQDKAVEKLMTDKNISKKAFDTKLAKITKTVDPHPKHHHKVTKGPEAMRPPKSAIVKQAVKKGVVKTIGKVASRAIPVIGAGLLTYDVLKTGVKRIVKGIKTGVSQTRLYEKGKEPKGYGGKTWSERRKESKGNAWRKNK